MSIAVLRCDKCRRIQNYVNAGDGLTSVFNLNHKDGQVNYSLCICHNCFYSAFQAYAQPESYAVSKASRFGSIHLTFRRKR